MSTMRVLSLGALLLLLGAGCLSTVEYGTVPLSGEWSFAMSGSDEDLTCTTGPSGFSSGGSVDLSVSDDGSTAVLLIDGQVLVFYEQGGAGLLYRTDTRYFPVQGSGSGTVYFEFVANTDDSIIGTLFWDNETDCTGAYAFTMLLDAATLPGIPTSVPYSLTQGSLGVDFSDVSDDCGGSIAGFSGFPTDLELSYVADLDTGELDSGEVFVEPLDIVLERVGDSNVYTWTGEVDVGAPVDAAGDILLDYDSGSVAGSMEIAADADGGATGIVSFTSGTCSGTASISLSL